MELLAVVRVRVLARFLIRLVVLTGSIECIDGDIS
jgi:hypothetical protein